MPELENYLRCPVCLGLPLVKLRFKLRSRESRAGHGASEQTLVLDYCKRCGGMWFDQGEVQQLQALDPKLLQKQIVLRPQDYFMPCHRCHKPMPRNQERCQHCHWENILDCPRCSKPMQVRDYQGLKLDLCQDCKGVWFDNIELAQLWNLSLQGGVQPGEGGPDGEQHGFSDILLGSADFILQDPFLTMEVIEAAPWMVEGLIEGAEALPELAGSLFEGAAHLPEVAGSIFEGAGDLAGGLAEASGSIFEFIADLLGDLFS